MTGDEIRIAREARKWSQRQLADAAGTNQQTVARIESGETGLSRALPRVLAALDVAEPMPKILVGMSHDDKGMVKQFASVEGGPGDVHISSDPIAMLPRPGCLMGVMDGFAVYLVGDSMLPEFEAGDTVYVHPRLPPLPGTSCIFYTDSQVDDRATIKRLVRVTVKEWIVRQWNPPEGKPAEFKLSRQEWPVCYRVVGRDFGRR